jgi:protein-S-isoprenylcysteine O-methyltransferase
MVSLAWIEYWVEWMLPSARWLPTKQWAPLSALGVALCIIGLSTRAVGMATASSNFSHKIEEHKRTEHALVTHGIYAYLRHPAYFGFFWFSVGTQVLLANPVCIPAYTAASWYFFYDRIPYEVRRPPPTKPIRALTRSSHRRAWQEELLVEFFGNTYHEYRKRTHIGIPFIQWATRVFPT